MWFATRTALLGEGSGSPRWRCHWPPTRQSQQPTVPSASSVDPASHSHRRRSVALYGDSDKYLARFEQATRAAQEAEVILDRDVEPLLREAESAFERAINGA